MGLALWTLAGGMPHLPEGMTAATRAQPSPSSPVKIPAWAAGACMSSFGSPLG